MMQPKPADYKVVGDALVSVGPQGVKEAYRAPARADMNQLIIPGPDGKPVVNQMLLDARGQIAERGRTQVTQSVGAGKFESEYDKDQGKTFSQVYNTIQQAGFNAPTQLKKLERMEQLLTGVDGGKLAPLGADIASAARSLGWNIDPKLGNKEAAESLAIEMALKMREPGTGPMTDKDFANFLNIVPSLAKSPEGRAAITQTMRASLRRDQAIAQMARDYAKQNGGRLDAGFYDAAAAFMAENPVVNLGAAGDKMKLYNDADSILGGGNGKR
jgi:hypothetical protein